MQDYEDKKSNIAGATVAESVAAIFDDLESRRNIVGLFDLLLKIDRRNHPELYDPQRKVEEKLNKKS